MRDDDGDNHRPTTRRGSATERRPKRIVEALGCLGLMVLISLPGILYGVIINDGSSGWNKTLSIALVGVYVLIMMILIIYLSESAARRRQR